jgi:hypothetical protein
MNYRNGFGESILTEQLKPAAQTPDHRARASLSLPVFFDGSLGTYVTQPLVPLLRGQGFSKRLMSRRFTERIIGRKRVRSRASVVGERSVRQDR